MLEEIWVFKCLFTPWTFKKCMLS